MIGRLEQEVWKLQSSALSERLGESAGGKKRLSELSWEAGRQAAKRRWAREAVSPPSGSGAGARDGFEPRAVAVLTDGRLIVAHGGEESALLLLDRGGRLLRVLAKRGSNSGGVFEPSAVAVDESERDECTRIAVIDRDGDRVQVFTLGGTCYGSFDGLPSAAS